MDFNEFTLRLQVQNGSLRFSLLEIQLFLLNIFILKGVLINLIKIGCPVEWKDLTENPQVWVEYGTTGRAAVEQRHNIHSLKDRLLQLFGALVGKTDADTSQRRSLEIEGKCEGV